MGSGNHVVVDVSSDDEEEEVDTRVDIDYFNWLNDVMEAGDEKSDSTDVVEVLSEVKGGIDSKYRKPNSSIQTVEDEDDDDCVILDSDPDKTTNTAAAEDDDKLAKDDDDDDDDDVLVVGQKGEIACRDFPHPRHSCAKYSFKSTSHEKYCDMCHCYVCDIPAPCSYWCIGDSTIDHCHANDKEKIWKNQREYFRTGDVPTKPSSIPTMPLPPSSTVTRQFSQNIIRLNTLPRNQVGIRPCSSSSRVAALSNTRARSRIKISLNHNHGLQNRPVQSLSSVRNNGIQKDRSSPMANLRSRVASTNGNNTKVGLYTNAHISQSTHRSSSVVSPPINPKMYTQLNVTDYCAAVTGSQSNVYTRHPGQNESVIGNCEFQATADLFAVPETPLTSADSQAHMVQQQPATNENVLQTKLSEFESWLMDSSNQTGSVSPLPELLGEDNANPLTFDFETFLND
uniref:RPM1 interacting protein 13 n=1 Tax=Noccaea caerulescens TaxID=107243 RepID=A0A1J3H9D4_NOCCA